jgi:membrane-bound inhibitor of C-type lysozyme
MRILVLIAAFGLAACQPPSADTASAPPVDEAPVSCANAAPSGEALAYTCANGVTFTAAYDAGFTCAIVSAGGETYRLPAVVAASGQRYSDGVVEYWEHHGDGMLTGAAGGPYEACKTPVVGD